MTRRSKRRHYEVGDNLGLRLTRDDETFLIPALDEFRNAGGEISTLIRDLLLQHFRKTKGLLPPSDLDLEATIAWMASALRRAANGEAAGPPLTPREVQLVHEVKQTLGDHEQVMTELDDLGEYA